MGVRTSWVHDAGQRVERAHASGEGDAVCIVITNAMECVLLSAYVGKDVAQCVQCFQRMLWKAQSWRCACGKHTACFAMFAQASNHMLNGGHPPNSIAVSPFAHNFSNNYGAADQQRTVLIPDVPTQDLPTDGGRLSMSAGDFLEVYDQYNAWDCIASVFFLDTARIVMAYLEHMYAILKPGGLLINLGPLQYHFSGNVAAPSVELSFEELRTLLGRVGFVLLVRACLS